MKQAEIPEYAVSENSLLDGQIGEIPDITKEQPRINLLLRRSIREEIMLTRSFLPQAELDSPKITLNCQL